MGALLLMFATLPLDATLVIPAAVRIPPYIVALPVVTVATALLCRHRLSVPRGGFSIAIAAWLAACSASLAVWIVNPPPSIALSAQYGNVRASNLRGPIQLAIIVAFLTALPITLLLARTRLGLAVAAFVGVATLIAAYGVYQVYAQRWGLPFQDINNDPITADRQLTTGPEGLLVRARSTFGEPTGLGHFLLAGFSLAGSYAIWGTERRQRALAAGAALLIWSGLVLTFSVGAWFGLLVLFPIVVAALVHRRAWLGGVAALAGIAAATFAVLGPFVIFAPKTGTTAAPAAVPVTTPATTTTPAPTTTGTSTTTPPIATTPRPQPSTPAAPPAQPSEGVRGIFRVPSLVLRRVNDRLGSSERSRQVFAGYQLELWRDHPVLGVGLGAGSLYLSQRYSPGSLPGAHGIWWGSLSETGTLGTAALLLVLAIFAARLISAIRRSPRSRWYPVLIGALGGVIAELADYLTFGEHIDAYVWVLVGLGLLAARAAGNEPSPQ